MRAAKVCAVAGCPTPALPGKTTCAAHRRIGGARWRRLREQVLARDRHRCVVCGRPATQVHHRRPLVLGGAALPPLDELDSRCEECHARGPHQLDEGAIVDRRRRGRRTV
jgi:5-methylcytosine-specific restriction endonuclease McrA